MRWAKAILLLFVPLFAFGSDPHRIPAITFTDSVRLINVGRSVWILEDRGWELTPEQALVHSDHRSGPDKVPNLGISSSQFWLRFAITNTSSEDIVILQVPNPEIDRLDVYTAKDTVPELICATGQGRATSTRAIHDAVYTFALNIPTGSTRIVLLNVSSNKQLRVPIVLNSGPGYIIDHDLRGLIAGGCFGIFLVMALYNLFVYFSIRDRNYLFYVIYILLVSVTQVNFMGYAQLYFWPDSPGFAVLSSQILTVITAIAAGEFMHGFIRTNIYIPRFKRASRLFYLILLGALSINIFGQVLLGYELLQIAVGLFAIFLATGAFMVWRRGFTPARYFSIAWILFLGGITVYIMKDIGLLPYNWITKYMMPMGSVAEVVLLSFGLADKINVLRREKENSQAAALLMSQENERIIRDQNAMLEKKVTQRTHDLQESNEHLKRTQTQLVNAEKMASLGQLTAGIAHEINNPINFITSNIQPLRRNITEILDVMEGYRSLDVKDAEVQLKALKEREDQLGIADSIEELDDIIGSISEGSSRTAEIVRGLRNFSRLDEDDLKEADINEGIRNTLSLLSPQLRDHIKVELKLGTLPPVECFPGKVNQVLMNILTNAVQATLARTDKAELAIRVETLVTGEHIQVRIKDNGIGMSGEVQSRMFDPFFTTKPVGEGTGLGLAIVYGIIQDHHGHIEVESTVGVGTEFKITLPIHQRQQLKQRA